MFKKLASFLFEEEEIIVEEEELHPHKEANYEIPKLDGIKARNQKEQESIAKPIETPVSEKVEATPVIKEKEMPNKIQRIDVDGAEKKAVKEKVVKPAPQAKVETVYQPQEIISPIFGGSEKKAEPIRLNKPKKQVKQTENSIISPMYGIVTEEQQNKVAKEVLEYDLEDMLSPEKGPSEVQVSLYDYLEELSDDE
ncbi:MAG TPA: hypothetical protein VIG45_03710 [Erysipelothrix sp.]